MPRFAANLTWMFTELEFPARVRAARRLGFQAVECQLPYATGAATLAAELASWDLPMVMFNMPPGDLDGGEYGLAGLPGREHDFDDSVAEALDYAATVNCRKLHMLAGIVPPQAGRELCLQTFIGNARRAARGCAPQGVTVLIEPINTFERPGYLITTTAEAREAIQKIDEPNVAIQFDFHNTQLMEGNLSRALRENLDVIRHMQIAGVPGRSPPDSGEINYPYLFDLIDELGYAGWVGCEYRSPGPAEDHLGWARDYGIGMDTGHE